MTHITAYIPRSAELEADSSDDDGDELDEVYSEWSGAVNMSASQLREWSKHPCSREASKDPEAVIKRNLRLLERNKSDWTDDDIEDAKRTISFIERMGDSENEPESPKDGPKGCPSEWAISLLNWAYNPFDSMPDKPEDLDDVEAVTLGADEPDGDSEELAEFEDGDPVVVDNDTVSDTNGIVLAPHEEDFKFPDPSGEGTLMVEVGDQTVYEVGVDHDEYATVLATEDEVSSTEKDEVVGDVDADPDEAKEIEAEENEGWRGELRGAAELEDDVAELASVSDVPGISRDDMGLPPWPESWRESDRPARLIAMDVWITEYNASFSGCVREMRGDIRSPNRFCASFKDAIYLHEYWRQ